MSWARATESLGRQFIFISTWNDGATRDFACKLQCSCETLFAWLLQESFSMLHMALRTVVNLVADVREKPLSKVQMSWRSLVGVLVMVFFFEKASRRLVEGREQST
jgi:hypothetical protein